MCVGAGIKIGEGGGEFLVCGNPILTTSNLLQFLEQKEREREIVWLNCIGGHPGN